MSADAGNDLQTTRLRLRWLRQDDAPLMLAVWNDPAFIRYVGDRGIRTVEEASEAIVEGAMQLYSDYGYGPYRVAALNGDEAMGVCGLFRRDYLVEPDIGFGLLPQYCRMGYAYEAARSVLDHARSTLRLPRVTAIVSPDNRASIGLIEKLGLAFERRMQPPGEDADVLLYATDW